MQLHAADEVLSAGCASEKEMALGRYMHDKKMKMKMQHGHQGKGSFVNSMLVQGLQRHPGNAM